MVRSVFTLEQFRKPVTGATLFLAVACFVDMYYTLAAVRLGFARETNPLLSPLLEMGDAPFLMVKGLSFVVPLTVLELIRPLSPTFIPKALRLGAWAYAAMYLFGSLALLKGILY